jgi:transmembrane sensor
MNKEGKDILKNDSSTDFEIFLEASSKLIVPSSEKGKEATWDKLIQSIENAEVKNTKIVTISSRTIWLSIAASIIVLLTVASLTFSYSTIDLVSPKGSFADVLLPDSSEVKLNADSRIEYRRYGWKSKREVKLNGEAYFNVKHGQRFTVLTEHGRRIIVTGTRFNVFSRGVQFEVKCFEGSVSVESPKSKPVDLVKGKKISLDKLENLSHAISFDSTDYPSWAKGDFYFNNSPFDKVLEELSRQFDIKITTTGFTPENRNYTGFFKRNNLIRALDLICIPMGFTYQISSDSIAVRINNTIIR